jgi:ATP-dependent RNA helicase DDX24/MAK5
LYVPRTTLEKH